MPSRQIEYPTFFCNAPEMENGKTKRQPGRSGNSDTAQTMGNIPPLSGRRRNGKMENWKAIRAFAKFRNIAGIWRYIPSYIPLSGRYMDLAIAPFEMHRRGRRGGRPGGSAENEERQNVKQMKTRKKNDKPREGEKRGNLYSFTFSNLRVFIFAFSFSFRSHFHFTFDTFQTE